MSIFKKEITAAGEAAAEVIEKTGDAADKLFTSKEEKQELDNADRGNARAMQQTALQQDDRFSKRAVYILAFFWSLAAVLYIFFVSFFTIPENNQRLVDTITGFLLGTIIAAIINYFFGSSHGSALKTQQQDGLIKRMLNKNK